MSECVCTCSHVFKNLLQTDYLTGAYSIVSFNISRFQIPSAGYRESFIKPAGL